MGAAGAKIEYVDWGIGNVFSDGTIELHKDLQLPKYRGLHDKILDHEKDHDFSKGFLHNLEVDVFHIVGFGGLIQFMASRPKTWVQLLPFYYTKKRGIVYDKNIILFYSVIAAGLLASYILIKFILGG